MQVIEMVSRQSLPTAERTHASTKQNTQTREPASSPYNEYRECVPRRPVILDAFDKIIDYDNRNFSPM